MQGVRTIHDLDARLRMMDEFDDYSEILSLGLPPIDVMAGRNIRRARPRGQRRPRRSSVCEASRSLRRLGRRAPDERTGGSGEEAERIPVHGMPTGCSSTPTLPAPALTRPAFPIFEIAARAGKPVLLHPARTAASPTSLPRPDRNTRSGPFSAGPYETSCTMARLIFSGVTTRLPQLKILFITSAR